MDLVSKFTNAEKKLVEYNPESTLSTNLHQVRVINIPYESNSDGPSEETIQKRINALPEEIKKHISGYSIQKEAAKLVRTNIARLILFKSE